MKLSSLALALLAVAATQTARADTYEVDNVHSSVIFGVKHLDLGYVYGRFNKLSGRYTLDADNPSGSQFEMAIAVDSVDTNNAQRDAHLKNADFFNAGEFPAITFKSTKVVARQDGEKTVFEVTGDFTMHGVTKSVSVELTKVGEAETPMGYRSGFVCTASLKRSDFGMNKMLEMIGDEVAITISFEGVRQGGAAAEQPAGTGAVRPRRNTAVAVAAK